MITAEQKEIFQHVCFGVLMDANGIAGKSPEYIAEKMRKKDHPLAAWQMLHPILQVRVREWAEGWKFPLDELLGTL